MRLRRGGEELGGVDGGRIGIADELGTDADTLCRGGGGSCVLVRQLHPRRMTYIAGISTTSLIARLSNSIKTRAVSAPSPRILSSLEKCLRFLVSSSLSSCAPGDVSSLTLPGIGVPTVGPGLGGPGTMRESFLLDTLSK